MCRWLVLTVISNVEHHCNANRMISHGSQGDLNLESAMFPSSWGCFISQQGFIPDLLTPNGHVGLSSVISWIPQVDPSI
jgi:hypothetical protein